jgi:regulator of nonsense transcripts 2
LGLREPKGPLDSSLKKHTTLLNKLRSALLTTPPATLIKEIDGLTLGKYMEEIAVAVVEGIGASKGGKVDIDGAEEVRSDPPLISRSQLIKTSLVSVT